MGNLAKVDGGRDVVVALRLSKREAAVVDAARGSLTRSAWLRWAVLDFTKRQNTRDTRNQE